ncbi:MAG: glycosyltransferase family 39 protein, partial [Candidatus Altiarchaeota archaeon]|nr:glycosyltransferase family 39 protein [Candidatus Altiarchaeota archaeon]
KTQFSLVFTLGILSRLYGALDLKVALHPDNLFQLLEPAHIATYGYGITPWEWHIQFRPVVQQIIVQLIFSMGYAINLKLADILLLNKLVMATISMVLLYVIYLLGKEIYGEKAGLYALFAAIFSPILWPWGVDVNSHIPATLFIVLSAFFLWKGLSKNDNSGFYSGLSLGVAFMFRHDSLIFLAPTMLCVLSYKNFFALKKFILGFTLAFFVQGVIDLLYVGNFLHTFIQDVIHNLIVPNKTFAENSAMIYLLIFILHIYVVLLMREMFEKSKRTYFVLTLFIVPLIVLSLIRHRELRFAISAVPFFMLLIGHGLSKLKEKNDMIVYYCVFLTMVLSGAFLTYAQLHMSSMPEVVSYDLFSFVGAQNDSTGLAYDMSWFYTGGYTYVHKRIPFTQVTEYDEILSPELEMTSCNKPINYSLYDFQCVTWDKLGSDEKINYLVLARQNNLLPDFIEIKRVGGLTLYRRNG